MTYKIQCSIRIEATPARVWALLQDFTQRTKWDVRVVKAQVITPPPQGKGSRFVITYRIAGIPLRIENEYIVWKPFERSAIRSVRLGRGSPFRSAAGSWHLFSSEDGTTTWTTIVSLQMRGGPLAPFLERLAVGWYFKRLTERSLRDFKRLVEGSLLADRERRPINERPRLA
jgi:hypothetical protein